MSMHSLAWRAVQRRDGHSLIYQRHVAVLAGLLVRVVAMLPLLEGYLLRELHEMLTVRAKCRGVERMATAAETGIAHVVRLGREVRRRRGMHHGLVTFVDVERPILGSQVVLYRFREHHVAHEGRGRPQPGVLNLVANRAGYAVCCRAPVGKLLQRK